MSEEQQIETTDAPEVKETPKEAPKFSREDYDRIQRETAAKSGWKDFDDYVAEGGDPAKWKTADAFNTYGELIGTVKKKEVEFQQRLQGVQQLAEARLAAQREELLAKRDAAIELGDVKEVHKIEKQMSAIPQPMPQMHPEIHILNEWNAKNAWVNEKTAKGAFARELWADFQRSNTPVSQALAAIDEAVAREFPAPKAPPPARIPESEKGRGSAGFGKSQAKAVTMETLTAQERSIWEKTGHFWKDQKAFLQSVTDSRKAEGGN